MVDRVEARKGWIITGVWGIKRGRIVKGSREWAEPQPEKGGKLQEKSRRERPIKKLWGGNASRIGEKKNNGRLTAIHKTKI